MAFEVCQIVWKVVTLIVAWGLVPVDTLTLGLCRRALACLGICPSHASVAR